MCRLSLDAFCSKQYCSHVTQSHQILHMCSMFYYVSLIIGDTVRPTGCQKIYSSIFHGLYPLTERVAQAE